MKFIAFALMLISQTAWSQDRCSTSISKAEMRDLIEQIKNEHFPDLKDIDLQMKVLRSKAYFLQTFVKPTTIFRAPLKRTYGVQINEKVFECSPSHAAIKAILIHEIQHIQDYIGMGTFKFETFGIKYALNRKFRTRYERATDLAALKLGQAEGLKEYREWVYQWLNPRQLATKKRFYYTPEEIDQWVLDNTYSL